MAKKVTAKKKTTKVKTKAKAKSAKKAASKPAAKKAAPKKAVSKKAVKKSAPAKKAKPAKAVKAKASVQKAVAKTSVKKAAPVSKPAAPKVDYTKAITPLGDRLVIRLTQSEKVTPGGLILPDSVTSTTGYLKGEVLAAGHGTYTKKGHHKLLDVQIGDTVIFNEYSSTKVKFNNEELHIVHENEVLGVTE